MKQNVPIVLCIAGSDSGGGAGIQADIKTLNTLKVFAATAITCITAQNTKEVILIKKLSADLIFNQIEAIKRDFEISAIKIGMLYDSVIMKVVSESLEELKTIPIIIDPVMISKSGDYLLKTSSINFFKKNIIPKSYLLTPNIHEALELTKMKRIRSHSDIEECFKRLRSLGARNILIKGGHLSNKDYSVDYLNFNNRTVSISGKRHNTKNTHGTGCTLSAAISGNIALGMDLLSATKKAKKFTNNAIKNSFNIGKGCGPLNHFA